MTFENDRSRIESALKTRIESLQIIGRGASLRRFYRIGLGDGDPLPTAAAMLCDDKRNLASYHRMLEFLLEHGVPVPKLYAYSPKAGVLVMEDLGDNTVLDALGGSSPVAQTKLLERILELALLWQRLPPDPSTPAYWLAFDREKFIYEYHFHVRRCLLEVWAKAALSGAESSLLEDFFEASALELAAAPWVLVHRDFQSTNLMLDSANALRLIDFQDARTGLPQYDLASWLYDSYLSIPDAVRSHLIEEYLRATAQDPAVFNRRFKLAIVQRKLHDAGAFVFAQMNGKSEFLRYLPGTVSLALDTLQEFPEWLGVRALLMEKLL